MNGRLYSPVAQWLFIGLAVLLFTCAGALAGGEGSIFLRLGKQHFDPVRVVPELSPGMKSIEGVSKGEKGYFIVHFDGPILQGWKDALVRAGAEIFDYIPDFAFIIRLDGGLVDTARNLPHVRWFGVNQPEYRISQSALDASLTANANGSTPVKMVVTVFPGENLTTVRSALESLGSGNAALHRAAGLHDDGKSLSGPRGSESSETLSKVCFHYHPLQPGFQPWPLHDPQAPEMPI